MGTRIYDRRPAKTIRNARVAPRGVHMSPRDFEEYKRHAEQVSQLDPAAVCVSFHKRRRRSIWRGELFGRIVNRGGRQ